MSETKLLPCPFCGGEAHKRIEFPQDADGLEVNMYIVGCARCGIEFRGLWEEDAVIEAWETRKPMDDIVERLEEKAYGKLGYVGVTKEIGLGTAIDIVRNAGKEVKP